MFRFCSLRQGPNFGVRPAAGKNFYLRLTVEKMSVFAAFTKKYLEPYDWSYSNFTAVATYTNSTSKIYH